MSEPLYRRETTRFTLGMDELTEHQGPIFPILPELPPPDGQLCRFCGEPAVSIQTKPLEFTAQEDIASDTIQFRMVQKYRFVCRDHELATDIVDTRGVTMLESTGEPDD